MGEYDDEPKVDETPRSKVKLSRNAKGDPQWEITVAEGSTEADLSALRVVAINQYKELEKELLGLDRGAAA